MKGDSGVSGRGSEVGGPVVRGCGAGLGQDGVWEDGGLARPCHLGAGSVCPFPQGSKEPLGSSKGMKPPDLIERPLWQQRRERGEGGRGRGPGCTTETDTLCPSPDQGS